MAREARITVLVDNTASGSGLLGEHGIAFWIDLGSFRALFDTGQGLVLLANAYKLGVPLYEADAIALSHGHYDHTGGMAEALKTNRRVTVYAHSAALAPKYARKRDGTVREIGMPNPAEQAIRSLRNRLVYTDQPTQIADRVTVTGPIPRLTDFEDTGGSFFLDPACTRPDPLEDDQSLFFDTPEGTVVLLGCAHSGVINTLGYIRQLTGGRPVRMIIGGMHLGDASPERIERTLEELRRMRVRQMAPGHCTGMAVTVALWTAFPGICAVCHVGEIYRFEIA